MLCCAAKKKIRNKETETQKGDIICLGSHSYLLQAQWKLQVCSAHPETSKGHGICGDL